MTKTRSAYCDLVGVSSRFAALCTSAQFDVLATASKRMHNNISTMSTLVSIASLKSEGAAPRYEQIANAVSQAIRSGQLKPGDRLPTVRALASDLGVSLTTVTAAFKSLAENGWTRGEIGRGTFVSERGAYEAAILGRRCRAARVSPRTKNSVAQTSACELDGAAALEFSEGDQLQFRGAGRILTAAEVYQAALAGCFR